MSSSAAQSVTSHARQPAVDVEPTRRLLPTHCASPALAHASTQHVSVSSTQSVLQASAPPTYPMESQVRPPRLAPSHASPSSTMPLPQLASVQARTSYVQSALQRSVPPCWVASMHVPPPRSAPSHCSPAFTTPLPQAHAPSVHASSP